MSYKTILVHCDTGPTTAQRLAVATGLARRFEAHLVGLQVHPRFEPAIHAGAGLPADAFYRAYEEKVKSDEAAVAAAFRTATGNGLSTEWRAAVGLVGEELAERAFTLRALHGHAEMLGIPARHGDGIFDLIGGVFDFHRGQFYDQVHRFTGSQVHRFTGSRVSAPREALRRDPAEARRAKAGTGSLGWRVRAASRL